MFVQHHTCCYLKGNTHLLYQEHTRSPECFSRSPRIQTDPSCSFLFPLSSHWVCSMPRHRPGTLSRDFSIMVIVSALSSYVIAKREYAMASCEMLLQLNLKASSLLLQPHMLKAAWKDNRQLIY